VPPTSKFEISGGRMSSSEQEKMKIVTKRAKTIFE